MSVVSCLCRNASVEGALAGHYELTLRTDDLLPLGRYPLTVRVNRKGTEVRHRLS